MKKIIRLISIIGLIIFIFPLTSSAKNIKVFLDENEIFFDVPPLIINNHTMVPMRKIFEELGYKVTWDEYSKKITGENGESVIEMTIDDPMAYINYVSTTLDSPPIITGNYAMVPLRFISEATGFSVYWNDDESRIDIIPPAIGNNTIPSINDSVVMITTNNMQGSGVIISHDGLIVTNYHVMEGAKYITITLNDNRIYSEEIQIVGFNKAQDLVIFKADIENLKPAIIGDSEKTAVHSGTVTVGSPLGNFNMTSVGKVLYSSNDLICTTNIIDHGSSGGGLFNSKGELIGITAAYDEAKNSFFIPINYIKAVAVDKNMNLKQFEAVDIPLVPPTIFDVKSENGTFYVLWNNVYDADSFHVYRSEEPYGEYKKVKNPKSESYDWFWGYPHCFGVNSKTDKKFYIKVSSVNIKGESELSQPIEVIINNNSGGLPK